MSFVRFAMVGCVATGIQYILLVVLVRGAGVEATVASCIGFVVSAGANYLMNYHFTFRSQRAHGPAAVKFATLAGVGLLLNAALMRVLVGAGWHYLLAQVCATLLVMLWNYFGNRAWTFGPPAQSVPTK